MFFFNLLFISLCFLLDLLQKIARDHIRFDLDDRLGEFLCASLSSNLHVRVLLFLRIRQIKSLSTYFHLACIVFL